MDKLKKTIQKYERGRIQGFPMAPIITKKGCRVRLLFSESDSTIHLTTRHKEAGEALGLTEVETSLGPRWTAVIYYKGQDLENIIQKIIRHERIEREDLE